MLKSNKVKAIATIGLLTAAGAANAALPEAAQTALDSVATTASDVVTWAWGVGTTVLVGFIGLKLVKKGANKAS